MEGNLKKQAEMHKNILHIVPGPNYTFQSQLKELYAQFHQNEELLKCFETHQRTIQSMWDDNCKSLALYPNNPLVEQLQSHNCRFDELNHFFLIQHQRLKKQQVEIKCRYMDIQALLEESDPSQVQGYENT